VRYERNDDSVPTAYGHRPVLVKGYVDEVVIACGAEIIARHPRSYAREDFIFDPRHGQVRDLLGIWLAGARFEWAGLRPTWAS
ncbi:MAG TPA: hypothetical protein VFZ10_08780, partial [Geminicoccaceae bacterium]